MSENKRFYIKIENNNYQIYDKEEQFSFNPCEDEFLAMQIVNALNSLEYGGKYQPVWFKNESDGELYKFYQKGGRE